MAMMNDGDKLQQYQSVGVQTSIVDADPHRLIQLLLQGAMDCMIRGKACIERNDVELRNGQLNKAIQIVGGLRGFLDIEKGGELALNLEKLYDYIEMQLFEANIKNDAAKVEECMGLLKQVKSAWDEIREQAVEVLDNQQATAAV